MRASRLRRSENRFGVACVGLTSLARVQSRLDYQGLDMNPKGKVSKSVTMLTAQGHRVEGGALPTN